jgi:hypothetical protein
MMHRLFGEEPTPDPVARSGQLIGTVIGLGILTMMVWVVLRGLF